MPADESPTMLDHLALNILEHALARGDVRAALFFLRERPPTPPTPSPRRSKCSAPGGAASVGSGWGWPRLSGRQRRCGEQRRSRRPLTSLPPAPRMVGSYSAGRNRITVGNSSLTFSGLSGSLM